MNIFNHKIVMWIPCILSFLVLKRLKRDILKRDPLFDIFFIAFQTMSHPHILIRRNRDAGSPLKLYRDYEYDSNSDDTPILAAYSHWNRIRNFTAISLQITHLDFNSARPGG